MDGCNLTSTTKYFFAVDLGATSGRTILGKLENGKIIERGNHEDLIAQKGKYYELYTGKTELE